MMTQVLFLLMAYNVFPDTILYPNQNKDHVIVKNGAYFYDPSSLVHNF